MGCNVSKEHQVEQGGGEDGSTKSGKGSSKNKKCNKKSSQAEINCIGTPATDTEEKKMELEKGDATNEDAVNSVGNKEQESMQFDPSDPELNAAAAKIQASFRGHKVRKELKKTADEIDMPTPKIETNAVGEEGDVDLNDPDVEKAATKIQASFRGYMVRKQNKEGSGSPTAENPGS